MNTSASCALLSPPNHRLQIHFQSRCVSRQPALAVGAERNANEVNDTLYQYHRRAFDASHVRYAGVAATKSD